MILAAVIMLPVSIVFAHPEAARHAAQSAFIRETLGVFTNMTEQTFSGVYSTASKDTQWLSLDSYAKWSEQKRRHGCCTQEPIFGLSGHACRQSCPLPSDDEGGDCRHGDRQEGEQEARMQFSFQ